MASHDPEPSSSPRFRSPLTVLLGLVAAIVAAGPAHAQDRTSEIDKIFSWATPSSPGCSVAVAQHGKVIARRAYGLADLERDVAMTPETIFDAASVVKQFVAAATLLLVEEGKLSLTEDVRKYVPELPDYGHRITLDHMLTHTSGIRDWTGLMRLTSGNADALTLTLRQRALNAVPGEEWSYSNSGYVLLKEIVARVSGMSFADFTHKRLFEPLGMKNSRYLLDMRDVVKNRALAYEKAGSGWRLDMQFGNERGGGGALLSTAGDLIIWNEALTSGRLGRFVTDTIQEPATLSNGRKLGYARGLYVDSYRGHRVIFHSGGSAGYGTFLARFPDQGLSTASMCNAGEMVTGGLYARRMFDLFVPPGTVPDASGAPAVTTPAPAIEGLDLKSKAGLFFNERNGDALRLGVEGNRLRIQGGPLLVTVTKDRFRNPTGVLTFMSGDQFELHFISNDRIELKSMEGTTTGFGRAQPYAPTADDLQAFAGRYESDEIGGFVDLAPAKDGLIGRANDAPGPPLPFKAVDRDTFQLAGVILRFHRDTGGKVVALDYSNPVVRNVRFIRVTRR
jgi:CubicO group peptidase (beta-lactamase class C family)